MSVSIHQFISESADVSSSNTNRRLIFLRQRCFPNAAALCTPWTPTHEGPMRAAAETGQGPGSKHLSLLEETLCSRCAKARTEANGLVSAHSPENWPSREVATPGPGRGQPEGHGAGDTGPSVTPSCAGPGSRRHPDSWALRSRESRHVSGTKGSPASGGVSREHRAPASSMTRGFLHEHIPASVSVTVPPPEAPPPPASPLTGFPPECPRRDPCPHTCPPLCHRLWPALRAWPQLPVSAQLSKMTFRHRLDGRTSASPHAAPPTPPADPWVLSTWPEPQGW